MENNGADLSQFLSQFRETQLRSLDSADYNLSAIRIDKPLPEVKERRNTTRKRRMDPMKAKWTIEERSAVALLRTMGHDETTTVESMDSVVRALLPQHDPYSVCSAAWGEQWVESQGRRANFEKD